MAQELSFDLESEERAEGEAFLVDVDGFEGPLDLLLELARRQKVDLARISILALAEQYLAFIDEARRVRLELAADYLVMAAWLAFLKSRLLLPEQPKNGDEPSAADLAAALAERLRRLELIRLAADRLTQRAQLGRDMFLRGGPEGLETISQANYQASLFDLLSAYARQRSEDGGVARGAQAAHGLVARRGARGAGAAGRRRRANGPCSTIFCCNIALICKPRGRSAPRLSRPRSRWCGKASSTFGRTGLLRRSGCAGARRSPPQESLL